MTMTKIAAAFCGSLLVFLLTLWLAETLYHVGHDGHGDHHEAAYVIEDDTEVVENCLLYTSPSPRDVEEAPLPEWG